MRQKKCSQEVLNGTRSASNVIFATSDWTALTTMNTQELFIANNVMVENSDLKDMVSVEEPALSVWIKANIWEILRAKCPTSPLESTIKFIYFRDYYYYYLKISNNNKEVKLYLNHH